MRREKLAEVLRAFSCPIATSREVDPRRPDEPERDRMTVSARAGDWMKLCALAGDSGAEYLCALPPRSRPTDGFIQEVSAIEAEVDDMLDADEMEVIRHLIRRHELDYVHDERTRLRLNAIGAKLGRTLERMRGSS